MESRGFLGEEVPCRVVGSGRLWNLIVRSRLDRVNEIRELDCILDEENRDVIPDNVKVALVGVANYVVISMQLPCALSKGGREAHSLTANP